jgi:exodeoxyribonuclease-3
MKVVTWNVNSIRTRIERVLALLERQRPDLLCLQETKVGDDEFPAREIAAVGYRCELFGQKGYNGVALLSRQPLSRVERGFAGDPAPDQARVIAGDLAGVKVVNLYVVNGESVGSEKYRLKLEWLDRLLAWLAATQRPAEPLLVLGDFNVAPEDRDVHDPELWRGQNLVSEPERERLRALLAWGLVDLLRRKSQEGGLFTWWDYRMGAFHRGWGLRIDLALGTAPVAQRLISVEIDRNERKPTAGPGKPSDHAPVVVTLE